MKKICLLFIIISSAMAISAQDNVINDPNAVLRSVASFFAIEISGSIDAHISQSSTEALAVSAKDAGNIDNIKTEVRNGVLRIWYNGNGAKKKGDQRLKAYIGVKTLLRIRSIGASDVYINGKLTGDLLQLDFSGASDFKGEIDYKKLRVKLSGASDASFKGSAEVLELDASGASDVNGYELQTEKCNVSASGASLIKITVNKELNAKANGASDIYYKGPGEIKNIQSSGASSVTKKD